MAAAAATCFQACRLRGRSPSSRALPAVAEHGGEQSQMRVMGKRFQKRVAGVGFQWK